MSGVGPWESSLRRLRDGAGEGVDTAGLFPDIGATLCEALGRHTPSVSAAVAVALTCHLEELDEAASAQALATLEGAGHTIRDSDHEWLPHKVPSKARAECARYLLLVLRISVLEKIGEALHKEAQGVEFASEIAWCIGQWVNAHIPLLLDVRAAGTRPTNAVLAAMLARRPPGPTTTLCMSALGSIETVLSDVSQFIQEDVEYANFPHMVIRQLPYKSQDDTRMCAIYKLCAKDRTALLDTHLVIAASLLGSYPHARRRPRLARRIFIYSEMLFCDESGTEPKLEATLGMLQRVTARRCSAASREVRSVIIGALREFLCVSLRFSPDHVWYLGKITGWSKWEASVFGQMDAFRHAATSTSRLIDPSQSSVQRLPNRMIYIPKVSFHALVSKIHHHRLSTGKLLNTPVDRVLTRELQHYLESAVYYLPYSVRVRLTAVTPPADATEAALFESHVRPDLFPLGLFYGTAEVIERVNRAQDLYEATFAKTHVDELLSWLTTQSLYQLQLVAAYCRAVEMKRDVQIVPLPAQIVRRQLGAARTRLQVLPGDPVDTTKLVTYVCMNCRRLCSHACVGEEKMEQQGADGVVIMDSCADLEFEQATQTRGSILPSFEELPRGITLRSYYLEEAERRRQTWATTTPLSLPTRPIHEIAAQIRANTARFAPVNVAWEVEPRRVVAPVLATFKADTVREVQAAEARIRAIFHRRLGTTATEPVTLVCDTKRLKNARRDARAALDRQRVLNATSERERRKAEHDLECRINRTTLSYYEQGQCLRTRVRAIKTIGYAILIGDALYLACTSCLLMTRSDAVSQRGTRLLCPGCTSQSDPMPRVGQATHACLICSTISSGTEGHLFEVVDDASTDTPVLTEGFLCTKCAPEVQWILEFPVVPSLSTIRFGVCADWKSLDEWVMHRSYKDLTPSLLESPELSSPRKRRRVRAPKRRA